MSENLNFYNQEPRCGSSIHGYEVSETIRDNIAIHQPTNKE